jgi:hypothetical protein
MMRKVLKCTGTSSGTVLSVGWAVYYLMSDSNKWPVIQVGGLADSWVTEWQFI